MRLDTRAYNDQDAGTAIASLLHKPLMTDGKMISQDQVAGFLLGLGIGLVVGLLFQPQANDESRRSIREGAGREPSPVLEQAG